MKNEEVAALFDKVMEETYPKDYRDRFVETAIYINETIKDSPFKTALFEDLVATMDTLYVHRK